MVGAAAGATGAAALGITGSDAVELTTLAAVAGAESGGDGDGSLTAAVAEGISPGQALSATSMPAVPGDVTDPSLDQAFSDLQQMLTNALASPIVNDGSGRTVDGDTWRGTIGAAAAWSGRTVGRAARNGGVPIVNDGSGRTVDGDTWRGTIGAAAAWSGRTVGRAARNGVGE